MTNREAIRNLKEYNKWRRGAETPQPDPKKLGKTIDWTVRKLELIEMEKRISRKIKANRE